MKLRFWMWLLVKAAKLAGPDTRNVFVQRIERDLEAGFDSHVDPVEADRWFKTMQICRNRLMEIQYR